MSPSMTCPRCGFEIPQGGLTSVQPVDCPSCGNPLSRRSSNQRIYSLVQQYFEDVWQIIRHPALFFRRMPTHGGLSHPLAFALITHWIGTALSFLWNLSFKDSIRIFFNSNVSSSNTFVQIQENSTNPFFSQLASHLIRWFFGTGSVITDPFLTLFTILFNACFIFLGVRILVSPGKNGHPQEITYESVVRLICYGLTPSLLKGIPFIGSFLASLCIFTSTVIGAKEIYRIETGRAIVITLFPKLLFIGIMGIGLLLFTATLMSLFSLFF